MGTLPDWILVKATGQTAVWIVVGGVRYRLHDLAALDNFDYAGPRTISEKDLEQIPACPPDGTLVLQQGEDPTIYIIRSGLRLGLPSPEELDASGLAGGRVQFLPARSLDAFPYAGKWPPRVYWLIKTAWGRWLLQRIYSMRVRRFARWIGNQAVAFVLGIVAGVITTVLVTGACLPR
jgi:hypothetical protein